MAGFGSLVKLPLGKHAVSGNWSEFLEVPGWAASVDAVVPLDCGLVPAYDAVPKPEPGGKGVAGTNAHAAGTTATRAHTPFPCIDKILAGDFDTGLRNNAIFHLALYCAGHGLHEDIAITMVSRANFRSPSPLNNKEIQTAVHSAYHQRRHGAKCGHDWLRDFCPGPCKSGWTVNATKAGVLGAVSQGDSFDVEVVSITSTGGRRRITVRHPDARNQPTFLT